MARKTSSAAKPGDFDDLIAKAHEDVDNRLAEIKGAIDAANKTAAATESWYLAHTAEHVHKACLAGTVLDRDAIEALIPKAAVSPQTVKFSQKNIEESKGFDLLRRVSRKFAAAHDGIADEIRKNGAPAISLAEMDLHDAEARLKDQREKSWRQFMVAAGFYRDLSAALAAKDADGIGSVLQRAAPSGIDARVIRGLLSKEIEGHDNFLSAIVGMGFAAGDEARLISAVVAIAGSDLDAMVLLQKTAAAMKDDDGKKRLQTYADAYAGAYVPIGALSVMSVQQFMNSRSEGRLSWHTGGSKYGRSERSATALDAEQANVISQYVNHQPHFLHFGDNEGFNADMIMQAGYDAGAGQLRWKTAGGSYGYVDWSRKMDAAEANAQLKALQDRGNFVALGNGTVLNTGKVRQIQADNTVASDGQRQTKLVWQTNGGKYGYVSWNIQATEEQAAAVLAAFDKSRKFFAFGNTGIRMNAQNIVNASYNQAQGQLEYRMAGGKYGYNNYSVKMEETDAASVIDKIAASGNFVHAGDNWIISANAVHSVDYKKDSGKVDCRMAGGSYGYNSWSWQATADAAGKLMADLEERSNFVRFGENLLVNAGLLRDIGHDGRGKINYACAGGSYGSNKWNTQMTAADADALMNEIAALPGMYRLSDKYLVRIDAVVAAHYETAAGRLKWQTAGGKYGLAEWTAQVPQAEGAKFIQALRLLGQRQRLARDFNKLRGGLQTVFMMAEDLQANNTAHQSTSLPLLTAGLLIEAEKAAAQAKQNKPPKAGGDIGPG